MSSPNIPITLIHYHVKDPTGVSLRSWYHCFFVSCVDIHILILCSELCLGIPFLRIPKRPFYPVKFILEEALPPCQYLCDAVRSECESVMGRLDFHWPNNLKCDYLPVDGRCIDEYGTVSVVPTQALRTYDSGNIKLQSDYDTTLAMDLIYDRVNTETTQPHLTHFMSTADTAQRSRHETIAISVSRDIVYSQACHLSWAITAKIMLGLACISLSHWWRHSVVSI